MDKTPQVGEESGRLVDDGDHVGEILGYVVIPDQRGGVSVGCKRENSEGAEENDREERRRGN